MNILDEITAQKRIEIEELKLSEPLDKIIPEFSSDGYVNFKEALSNLDRVNIIAEIKKGSPSKGIIQPNFNPVAIARAYSDGGATALSVLTESHFFFGRHEYLTVVKNETSLPLLCKDFIIDPYQLYYARYMKADAVLLIVRILTPKRINKFLKIAKEIELDCIVEVHNEEELDVALDCDSEIIGINNRNLNDFSVSLETSEILAEKIPDHIIKISESGILNYEDILRLKQCGFNNFLIGEALMKADDPAEYLRQLQGKE